jgi:hypothetical protein
MGGCDEYALRGGDSRTQDFEWRAQAGKDTAFRCARDLEKSSDSVAAPAIPAEAVSACAQSLSPEAPLYPALGRAVAGCRAAFGDPRPWRESLDRIAHVVNAERMRLDLPAPTDSLSVKIPTSDAIDPKTAARLVVTITQDDVFVGFVPWVRLGRGRARTLGARPGSLPGPRVSLRDLTAMIEEIKSSSGAGEDAAVLEQGQLVFLAAPELPARRLVEVRDAMVGIAYLAAVDRSTELAPLGMIDVALVASNASNLGDAVLLTVKPTDTVADVAAALAGMARAGHHACAFRLAPSP